MWRGRPRGIAGLKWQSSSSLSLSSLLFSSSPPFSPSSNLFRRLPQKCLFSSKSFVVCLPHSRHLHEGFVLFHINKASSFSFLLHICRSSSIISLLSPESLHYSFCFLLPYHYVYSIILPLLIYHFNTFHLHFVPSFLPKIPSTIPSIETLLLSTVNLCEFCK